MQSYQSFGSCSAQPGFGWNVWYGDAHDFPTTRPVSASKQHALIDSVPPSTPITIFLDADAGGGAEMSDIAVAAAIIISTHIVVKIVDREACCDLIKEKATMLDDF